MGKIKCNLTFGESLLFLLGWFLLLIITFGLAAPFFILSFSKYLINRSILVENGIERRMSSNLNVGGDCVYLVLWTIFSIITFGIAGIFFIFSLGKRVTNSIEIA
ncbi:MULTISPECIES: DUF6693 family protein [Psychrilyobacter]|uniref:Uncharacterized protein n=1 Tax=Psychrilyobacter piezotolerans TaxID=2293438 RepID=A0ABX9KL65_9FUSO|nr:MULTISPECIES: DUF6693 family protein [Psychrilyobacter]MCS5422309.1 hypothetical protein [Psychrilyobacter sp. S5]NDI76509.1 hypothetical protein [Psychrilyobacter piezotolerans]RDE66100.1 hypothetical protein DV867_01085 [Psychrilyobacter sp. S5]REI43278.1 hypothetical protein DYH56_01085 [Psychrilyobacter piezotolerans]